MRKTRSCRKPVSLFYLSRKKKLCKGKTRKCYRNKKGAKKGG